MKNCPNCSHILSDEAVFCSKCGAPIVQESVQQTYIPAAPYDHTPEFDPADIADNKIFAMLSYLSILVVIPLFAVKGSPYTDFHVRQGLKLLILEAAAAMLAVLLSWTVVFAVAAVVAEIIIVVLSLMGLFSVGNNQAKELPIIRNIKFFN